MQRTRRVVYRVSEGEAPKILLQVCMERGWVPYDEHVHGRNQWNLWWRSGRWPVNFGQQLQQDQIINHVPFSGRITRKDLLARNLRCMMRVYGNIYNFSPPAFILPNEFLKFITEYNKPKDGKANIWICKPTDQSRGQGIIIFSNLSDLVYDCNVVVQKYISNPFLVSGYKFDLRLYVCVPSFRPLSIYVHRSGLVRFGTEKYSLNVLQNVYSHLTNTSINKFSPSFDEGKGRVGPGCKWRLPQLRELFRQLKICDWFLWQRISCIITLTLLCQISDVPYFSSGFELYGFDILIDANLRPWLLEVNRNPSLNLDTEVDVDVKKSMLHDLMDLLGLERWLSLSMERSFDGSFAYDMGSCLTAIPAVLNKKKEKSKKSNRGLIKPCKKRQPLAKKQEKTSLFHQHYADGDEESSENDSTIMDKSIKHGHSLVLLQRQKHPMKACESKSEDSMWPEKSGHYPLHHPGFRWKNPPIKVGNFTRIFPYSQSRNLMDPVNIRPTIIDLQSLLRLSESVIKYFSQSGIFPTDEQCNQHLHKLLGEEIEVWLPSQ